MTWIQIFKAGKHTSSNGVTAVYDNSFQQAVVDNYNANVGTHTAPLTLGHNPKSGDPAQAWFSELRLNGDVLEGKLDDVNPSFNTAQYKKVSSSFFLPDSPSNPTPGYPNLRHVAALGAETPAVAGLKNISFSEDSTGVVEFADGLSTQLGLFRSIREWIVSKFGIEDADQAVPASEVEWLNTLNTIDKIDEAVESATGTDAADTTDTATVAPAFSAAAAVASADFAAREAALATKESEFAAREAALQDAECANFCEGLVASGQLRPCDTSAAKNILASLYKVGEAVDFAESTLPAADAFKQFLKNLPRVVEFGEVAAEEHAPANPVADFVAAPGYEVDESGSALRAAIAQEAEQKGISFAEAAARYTQR